MSAQERIGRAVARAQRRLPKSVLRRRHGEPPTVDGHTLDLHIHAFAELVAEDGCVEPVQVALRVASHVHQAVEYLGLFASFVAEDVTMTVLHQDHLALFVVLIERGRVGLFSGLAVGVGLVERKRPGQFGQGDFFKLREVTLSVPFADRYTFTVSGHNVLRILDTDEFPVFEPEMGNNNDNNELSRDGASSGDFLVTSMLEHVPPATTWTFSIRATF